ncbi:MULTISPECIES: 3'-5' exonuclease [unclassified Paenibacillus]|uniref:3'-5' exonuclease n=1 Tax=unclassified Paenibacillus TaxID=185978 RepID=UPI0024060916|nr:MULTISPECIES: 3'-5' exonuclease [unclassified Paenibacillus]MDF9845114.1 DNA polymerase-3 subunit epsilon [Paenibacillus sp. PastF-2]MDF9851713.1 DNA polymerase-3 subunit epsilon [Paenibacillus sp. PastM-2]MDF9858334.1 DNA polymerase-3 subunit epsilon [Paenibacillus sp. PastF-1]MDH6483586.1 DNA polymerase-3 subunit epsilon [Paenibacillus sp. PastH-2]MDH6511009.1 DNA polymerase-3 subunit epsilon [Paenibacillus sp. PastM-3]
MILNDITVFDFETTGLNPENERIIEMAAIRVVGGQLVTGFHTLVNPGRKLDPKITEITGITEEMLVDAMDENLAIRILRNIMGSSLLVAHNAAFDLQFLHWAMQRLAGKTFENPFIDTMTISRERTTYPHKLTDMCGKYGIVLEGAHRALNDVEGCWELLKALHEEESVLPFVNRLGYLSKYDPPAWAPAYAELFPTQNKYEKRGAV